MKFYAPKYKQLDLGLLRSSLEELDKTNHGWLSATFFHGLNLRRNTTQGWTIRRKVHIRYIFVAINLSQSLSIYRPKPITKALLV